MRLRRAICLVTIVLFLAFMVIVYFPQLGARPSLAALSVLSDCTDVRTAQITVNLQKPNIALVDVMLLDGKGAASAGACNELQVQFPGKTAGGEIFSQETFELPGVPKRFKKRIDAGVRLTRRAGIGDGDELSLSLAGTPPVAPALRFLWVDATTPVNFSTDEVSIPVAPISVNGSSLVPVKHVGVDLTVPSELENASLTPSPRETLPLKNDRLNKYDFLTGAGVITLKWTNSVRNLIKEVGVVVLSLLAGAAISDLLTTRPEPRVVPQNSTKTTQKPDILDRRRRRNRRTPSH